jgi:hypothetical protein
MKDYKEGYGPQIRQHLTHEYGKVKKIIGGKTPVQVFAEVSQFVISELAEFQLSQPIPTLDQSMVLTT